MKNKVENILLVLICFFLPWMFYINIGDTLVNISVADAVFVIAGIYIFIDQLIGIYQYKRKGKEKPVLLHRKTLFAAGYFLMLILSLVVSHFAGKMDPKLETVSHITLMLEIVKTLVVAGYFFIGYILVKDEKGYRITLHAIVFGSIPAATVGFLAYAYKMLEKPFFLKQFDFDMGLRFTGSFQDPNLCALYYLMVFYLSLYLFKAAKSRIIAWAMGITSVIALVVIILTMSRGGWLAFGASLILFLALQFRKLRKETILIGLGMFVAVFSVILLDLRFSNGDLTYKAIERIELALYQGSNLDRVYLSKAAITMGNEHFVFGVGKGNYILNENNYLSEEEKLVDPKIPHNTILSFYAQQGIVGVIIFLLLPGGVIYYLIKKRTLSTQYIIILFTALFIQSLSLNIENIRFIWFLLGSAYIGLSYSFEEEYELLLIKNNKVYRAVCGVLSLLLFLLYFDTGRRISIDIYAYDGNIIERKISIENPGIYNLVFDVRSDDKLHKVEIYGKSELIDVLNFKNAYGFVKYAIEAEDDIIIRFISGEGGWINVSNAYIEGTTFKSSLQNYILLPKFIEHTLDEKGLLLYRDSNKVAPIKIAVGADEFAPIDIEYARIKKYSNLTTKMEFGIVCKEKMDKLYQLHTSLLFNSISDLLVNEPQKQIHLYWVSLSDTKMLEVGKHYTAINNILLSTDKYDLYGRFYDFENMMYVQDTLFEIPYELKYFDQDIKEFGSNEWINALYNTDGNGRIRMSYNGWIETKRYNLKPGTYIITISALGSYFDGEFSKLRLRDSFLNEIDSFYVDDETQQYKIKYYVKEKMEGVSFLLELINFEAGEGKNRNVYVEPIYIIKPLVQDSLEY